MSSSPLISHHLFVAAVKENSCVSRGPSQTEGLSPRPEVVVRDIPVELVDFGRPLPIEAAASFDGLPLPGSS
jgi:hypothetical protein